VTGIQASAQCYTGTLRPSRCELGHSLLEAMPIAAFVCDLAGTVIDWNAHARALWGEAMCEGAAGDDFFLSEVTDALADAPPGSPIERVRQQRLPLRNVETLVQPAQGAPRRAIASVVPLTNDDGALCGMVNSFLVPEPTDDSEDLFENRAVGVHVLSSDGVILHANQADIDLTGYARGDYVGRYIGDFHADPAAAADMLARLAAGETLDRFPARLKACDGSIRHVQISSSARTANGRSRCFSVDVTSQKHDDDAARQRDQLWRAVLQALPAAIDMNDAEGRVTFFNDAAVEFVGRTPVLGEPWSISWKLFHPDGRPMPHSEGPMAIALREGRALHGEEAIAEQPGGMRLAFKAYPTPLFDEAGKLVGAVNLMVDITEHRKIEQALQDLNSTLERRVVHRTNTVEKMFMKLHRSESHFELLVKNATDYAVYMLDPDGHIISWNEGAERVKGYTAPEIMGRHFSLFYTPEDRDAGMPEAALAAARRNGSFGIEGWRVRKDGSRFWASVVVHTTIDDGRLVGFVKITRDVTERREHELALIESEQQARGVIDTALDGFAQLDEAGRITEWNPRAESLFGWDRQEVLGRDFVELAIAGKDRERFLQALPTVTDATLQHGSDDQFEAVRRDGGTFIVEFRISALRLSSGDWFNIFIRDLSEKILVESQLRQAQKMDAVGQLTSGIAHDFNNLLQGIIGALELVEMRVRDKDDGRLGRFINGALTSANRAAALTHRMLAFSRRQPLDPRHVRANPLITSMEEFLRRTMGERIRIELDLSADLWVTLCDPNQLENALLNLAINARDAMPEGGLLTVRTRNVEVDRLRARTWQVGDSGQYVGIEVSDTGTGMPADVAGRAFDPFFTTKPSGKGTGLGLSMVYGFARQSNGHCELDSHLDQGTRITLYLPRTTSEEAAAPPSPSVTTHPAGSGEVVLVVEDETMVRLLVIEVLHQLGYQTLEAVDAEEALRIIDSSQPIDLLVSDIGLPGMNGRAMAGAARQRRPGLQVLLMTGYASEAAAADGFLEPGMQLITKPFTVELLARRIGDMVGGARAGAAEKA
jgi:PAS domain S-box-containing protein